MLEGIDVSSWQGKIDWAKVKGSGVSFAFIKATEGVGYTNPRFKSDWSEAKLHGVIRGAYHFFDPGVSPADQARKFISTVGALEPGDLPPALDLEGDKWNATNPNARIQMILSWLRAVEVGLGLQPIIYTSFAFAKDILKTGTSREVSHYRLWIAHYTSAAQPLIPPPWSHWDFWQHTNHGRTPGVTGNVDHDRFFGSHSDLLLFTKPERLDVGS